MQVGTLSYMSLEAFMVNETDADENIMSSSFRNIATWFYILPDGILGLFFTQYQPIFMRSFQYPRYYYHKQLTGRAISQSVTCYDFF